MESISPNSPLNDYLEYVNQIAPLFDFSKLQSLIQSVQNTDWDNPESGLDLNNFAVMALIEAESTEDLSLRSLSLNLAIEALIRGIEQENHPLCIAHLALIEGLLGERQSATQRSVSNFINNLQLAYNTSEKNSLGLIYLPVKSGNSILENREHLLKILQANDGYYQALLLSVEAWYQAKLVSYNAVGLRILQLAISLFPDSVSLNINLGISSLINQQWEGLLYLQKARILEPNNFLAVQSLYLAYRDLNDQKSTKFWYDIANNFYDQNPQSVNWAWAKLSINNDFTYIPFEDNLLITVEASFRSFVTGVLLGQGDWFESEMELWRNQIKTGMTVIDVGANAGVYTFSAAKKVGTTGKVLAVEPFSACVKYLEETCRVNQLTQVKVCAGAASDYNGIARLSLCSASELNEIVTDEVQLTGNFEEVTCFTLDSLIEQEQLNRVDWLKIDAEGHEMKVLAGSERLLNEFKPNILYENIAGSKGSNTSVAQYLMSKGYQLFRYQPFLQQLISINSDQELQGNLNIIALHQL